MSAIFVSYRRDDTRGYAGRLVDALAEHYDPADLVRDIDSIPAGSDFEAYIRDAVARCGALIAIVGPEWLETTTEGRRRIDDPADFVRLEIASALELDKVVVPVLVGGARMPGAAELPDVLAPFARRQAHELNERHWRSDVARLARELARVPGIRRRWWRLRTSGRPTRIALVVVALMLACVVLTFASARRATPTLPPDATPLSSDLLALGPHGGCVTPPECGTPASAARSREIEMRRADVALGANGRDLWVAAELRWVLRGKPWGLLYRAYSVNVLYRVPVHGQDGRVFALAPALERYRGVPQAGLFAYLGGWLELPWVVHDDAVARDVEARIERLEGVSLPAQ
jgi:hypothetical protein